VDAITSSTIPLERIACPLCAASEYQVRYRLSDLALERPGVFTLVECSACGLLYQNPRPTLEAIGAFYPPEYAPFETPPWVDPRPLRRLARLYGLKKRWRVVEDYAPARAGRRSILDIGCATGVFLAAGSDAWEKTGVELSAYAADYARQRFGLRVHTGVLEDTPLEEQQFDVVTMWDVLEHLHDPLGSLRRVRALLRPDGVLVARVPNRAAVEARWFGDAWAGFDQPRHTFVPDRATLTVLLERAGLRLVALPPLGGSYAMLVLSWTFWLNQRMGDGWQRRLARRVIDNLPVRLALLPAIWFMEHQLGKGSSLTVVAQPACHA